MDAMSRMEERAVTALARTARRWPLGGKIILAGAAFAALCGFPLFLYVLFGPSDGNPIGLGLLFTLGVAVMYALGIMGLIVLVVERLARRGGS